MPRVILSVSIVIVALSGAGCARGGGGDDPTPSRDAGARLDAGPRLDGGPGLDGGPVTGLDAGPVTGLDGGPVTGLDSGPLGVDSGTRDGGPIGVDSGPVTSCTESPCRLVSPQCGCAAGQACYLTGATRACAAAGTGTEGAACTSSSSCAPGFDCINFSGTASGQQCTRYCGTDTDCGGRAGALCIGTLNDGAGGTVPGVRTCTAGCNPVTSLGCAPGLGCAVYRENSGAMRWLTDCGGPVGSGTQDAPCFDDSDCARGHLCDTMLGLCLSWCRVGVGSDCDFGYTCYRFTTPAVIGGTEYGVCDL